MVNGTPPVESAAPAGSVWNGRAGTLVVTGLFLAASIAEVINERFLSGAQLWAKHLAAIFWAHPVETAFLPGSGALDAAIFAPFAASLEAFGLAHVVLGALAIPLVAERARSLTLPHPNIAALFVGASPVFLAAAPAGLPEVDGLVLVALALLVLDAQGQPTPAGLRVAGGLLLGLLGVLRPELSLLGLGIAWARRDGLVGGLAAGIPALFLGAGAIIEGDAAIIGLALTTPSLHGPVPLSATSDWAVALLAACPALGLGLVAANAGVSRVESREAIVAGAFAAIVLALGTLDVHLLGLSPARLIPALPLVAVPLARAVPKLCQAPSATRVTLGLVFALAAAFALNLDSGAILPFGVVALWGAVVAAGRLHPRASMPALVLACALGGPVGVGGSRLSAADEDLGLHAVHALVRENAELTADRRLVTDSPFVHHLFGEAAASTRFTWPERSAAPLGLTADNARDYAWLLAAHPFGETFFWGVEPVTDQPEGEGPTEADGAGIEVGDVLIVGDDAVQERLAGSRRVHVIFAGERGIYERVVDQGLDDEGAAEEGVTP